jgi:hypothetical protein
MPNYKLTVFGAMALLAACASKPATPQDTSFLCKNANDCNTKWSMAVAWAYDNAPRGVETRTDNLIQTYGSTNYNVYGSSGFYIFGFTNYSSTPGYTINRTANPDGSGAITFQADCTAGGGCIPSQKLARQSFAAAIGG